MRRDEVDEISAADRGNYCGHEEPSCGEAIVKRKIQLFVPVFEICR